MRHGGGGGGSIQCCRPGAMVSADERRDGNVSDFASITPLGLVLLFNGWWRSEEQEVGQNRAHESTREESEIW